MRIRQHVGNADIDISDERIRGNLREAQIKLNERIVADCNDYIPFQQGDLREKVEFPEGIAGGEIMYNTPYAHYQYMGEVYGPNIPIYDSGGNLTGYWSPEEKYPTGRPIHYHTAGTGKEWFEVAKRRHGTDWLRLVRETVGRD